jgi:ketosteroid isomerase-like protein
MKKLFLIVPLIILLCFVFGCEKEGEEAAEEALEAQALTDAQKMEIEETLKTNYRELSAAMMEMNVDGIMAYYSDTDFQEALMGITIYTSKDSFKDMFIEMFEGRESHGSDNLEIKVTVLSVDTAYVFTSYDYTINYSDGRIFDGKAVQTMIWKMEPAGWKITHDHVSWAGKFLEE